MGVGRVPEAEPIDEARILSADLVQRNGLGPALCWSMKLGDCFMKRLDTAVDSAPDLLLGDEREELDLVELRHAGWR